MSRIEHVRVTCVGPPAERPTWSHDLPEQFMTLVVVRVRDDEDAEGIGAVWNATSFDFDRYTAEAMRHLIPILVGRNPLDREAIMHDMRPRVFPLPGGALAAIEVALFDLAAQRANLPLHRLLGGTRDRIPAYASPPLLADIPAYLEFVAACLDDGFRAIKFHTWCDPARDLALARAVRREHPGGDIDFMLDVENNYSRDEAMRAGRELADARLSPDELLAAFKEIVAAIGGEQLTSLYEEFTVKEKIALVHERLALTAAFSFLELVRGGSAIEIICAFWAVLELAKTQAIAVIQRHQFAAITVERGQRAAAPDRAGQ